MCPTSDLQALVPVVLARFILLPRLHIIYSSLALRVGGEGCICPMVG